MVVQDERLLRAVDGLLASHSSCRQCTREVREPHGRIQGLVVLKNLALELLALVQHCLDVQVMAALQFLDFSRIVRICMEKTLNPTSLSIGIRKPLPSEHTVFVCRGSERPVHSREKGVTDSLLRTESSIISHYGFQRSPPTAASSSAILAMLAAFSASMASLFRFCSSTAESAASFLSSHCAQNFPSAGKLQCSKD